jgi:hypothetical protein
LAEGEHPMTGASKILTVSYGTFSCTLEGFDDPFNTMKAIAEYFRDLAAEDRYFGAEPPTPDAAMLHRIAEREIHRRVEAKIQDNGVILRAGDEELPETFPVAPRPGVSQAPLSVEQGETVAAKLQRIRAGNKKFQPEPALPGAEASNPLADDEAYLEDQHAQELPFTGTSAQDAFAESSNKIEESDQMTALLDEQALEADLTSPAESQELIGFSDQVPEDFAEFVIEDHIEQPAASQDLLSETQIDAQLDAAEMAEITADLGLADEDDLISVGEAAELAMLDRLETSEIEESYVDNEAGLLARLNDPLPEDIAEGSAPTGTAAIDDDDALLASLGAMIDPEAEASAPIAADEAPAAEDTPPLDAPLQAEPPFPEAAEIGAKLQRARARVIRIRRAEPAPEAQATPPEAAPSLLSDEAEAALQAELAALEAEIGGDLAADETTAATPAIRAAAVPADRARLDSKSDDEAVNRLLAQANSQMDGEDTRRRQSAISHLKAAVAATVAERRITGNDSPAGQDPQDAYREDLNRVVRPRRPGANAPVETLRAPPLVLVSEQRIDRIRPPEAAAVAADAPRVVMPVRPRRVAPVTALALATQNDDFDADDADNDAEIAESMATEESDNVFSDARSFEEFADRLGARRLPELLEAAAVYCAEVLNRPEFSRPLVMRQIADIPASAGASREDCLRGFGTLMRQGRITKGKRGMFAVTERSPYLAEARKITR